MFYSYKLVKPSENDFFFFFFFFLQERISGKWSEISLKELNTKIIFRKSLSLSLNTPRID